MYGLTEGGAKRTGRDAAVLPRAVIYDPELSLGLPFAITVVSAINAIAHAAEGLYAPDGNPVIDLFAEEGIRRCAAALPRLQREPARPRRRAATPWSAPGCAARSWAAPRSACITSSATRSAAASACRMRSCTPWCCRMPSPTTRRPPPRRCARSPPRLQAPAAPAGVFDLAARHGAADLAAGDRHARGRPRPRRRSGDAGPVSEPASARAGAAARAAAARLGRRSSRLRERRATSPSAPGVRRSAASRPSARRHRSRCAAPRSPRSG